ncbi:hypothetical protein VST7929_02448 [Vibrio stylophorae]|uniref:Chromosome partitioning protein ParA n=1 Tax=Vibrio stylophorae TaxID=659351 RepID=A0ABN8DXF8_9VIBR|nr:hypothetical protein [Vibrio stylophorae]CAH0534505.1 hypothetical protein VST7929_02448 [Vibrio stylophorae]
MKPWLTQEFDLFYQQVIASGAQAIAVTGSNHQCGCSTMSRWLAQRIGESGESCLLVDLDYAGQGQGIDSMPWQYAGEGEKEALKQLNHNLWLLPQSSLKGQALRMRQPEIFKQCLQNWQAQYHYLIFDAGSLCADNWRNLPAVTIAKSCQSTLLVVGAGQTSDEQLVTSSQRLSQVDANVLGLVINDYRFPSLASELCRSMHEKGRWIPYHWRQKLQRCFMDSQLLRGEYNR